MDLELLMGSDGVTVKRINACELVRPGYEVLLLDFTFVTE